MCHFLFLWQPSINDSTSYDKHSPLGVIYLKEGSRRSRKPQWANDPQVPYSWLWKELLYPDMGKKACVMFPGWSRQNLKLQIDPNLSGPGASLKLFQYDNPNGFPPLISCWEITEYGYI